MKKIEPVHVLGALVAVNTVVMCFTNSVVVAFFYALMMAAVFVSATVVMDLMCSLFTERFYRRDRVLADYVPARGGNVWLTVGVVAVLVWGAFGFAVSVSSPDPSLFVSIVVGGVLCVGVGLSWFRARRDARAFRVEVDAARDESLDRRFWEIVNKDGES